MKGLYGAVALIALVGLAGPTQAAGQVDGVNIVYPIDGGTYPITDPGPGGLGSAYFASSFSVKCGGGPGTVEWGFNASAALGSARFYDQTSVQFVHKLPGGAHYFWVRSDCGRVREGTVKFRIGS
jgi:hypothetical protein